MVLPPQLHRGSWEELRGHLSAVFDATPLPCMLYNNPIAYGTDVLPWQVAALAGDCAKISAPSRATPTFVASPRSGTCSATASRSSSVSTTSGRGRRRRRSGLDRGLGQRPAPRERPPLPALDGRRGGRRHGEERGGRLYRWFLPLLRMDVVPEFVHLIKLCRASVGRGSPRCAPATRRLEARRLAAAQATIAEALLTRPWPSGVDPTD
ncbi:MAG: dihydrodipicolinate synthase family protein [Phycisphaerales bacterium]